MTARTFSGEDLPSVAALFASAVRDHADRVLLDVADGRRLTYREAAVRAAALVRHIRDDLGLQPGASIVAYSDDTPTLVMLLLAAAVGRFVLVPVSSVFSVGFLREVMSAVGTSKLFVAIGAEGDAGASAEPCRVEVFPRDEDGSRASPSFDAALAMIEAAAKTASSADTVLVLPTSGSTGKPKLVVRSARALVRVAHFFAEDLCPSWERTQPGILLALSLTHGLAYLWISLSLRTAGRLAIPTRNDAAAPLEEVRRLDPDLLPMVPRVLRSFRDQATRLGIAPATPFGDRARLVWVSGAPADLAVLEELMRHGMHVGEGYGTTESSAIAFSAGPTWRKSHRGGKLLPDVEARIDADGELLVRSPGMMAGYLGDEALTRTVLTDDGFYRTGDFAELTPDGYVAIRGRKRDVFNTFEGSNVYPAPIEAMIEERVAGVTQSFLVGDGKPYVVALLVVDGLTSSEADGYLEPSEHREIHARAREALAALNAGLERVEKVAAFALFATSFPADAYRVVGLGKIRRARDVVAKTYEARIAALYSRSIASSTEQIVPGAALSGSLAVKGASA